MFVYFHIDELSRDAIVASALRDKLKETGDTLIYGNRFCMRLLKHLNVFDVVILPSIDHYMLCYPDPEKLPENVVVMPTEAVGQATGRLRRINAKYFGTNESKCAPWHKSIKFYLLWGNTHLNPFKEFYPEYLKKCEVVGHPRLADVCTRTEDNKKRKKPVVGIISRFSLLNQFDGRSNFASIFVGMRVKGVPHAKFENSPDHDIEDLFYTEVIDFRILLQVIRALDTERFDIQIRAHPREDRTRWQHLINTNQLKATVSRWDDPFSLWLNDVDIVVSPPSTSFYDIFAHNKRPICIGDIVPKRATHVLSESDDNNEILNFVFRPKSVTELVDAIESGVIPDYSKGVESILDGQTATNIAHSSISNIATVLSNLISTKPSLAVRIKRWLILVPLLSGVVSVAYLLYLRAKFVKGGVQGSTFALTLGRIGMINRLSRRVSGAS